LASYLDRRGTPSDAGGMSYSIDDAVAAMARAKDRGTAGRILEINIGRFASEAELLRSAFLRRISELRTADGTLEQDVWTSMELACTVLGTKFNPQSRNSRQMPEMVRKYGPAEAVKRTIIGYGSDGTSFFQRCVSAGSLTYTSEAICLRHQQHFDDMTKHEARIRLDRHPDLPR
jgi:hypothetical protein